MHYDHLGRRLGRSDLREPEGGMQLLAREGGQGTTTTRRVSAASLRHYERILPAHDLSARRLGGALLDMLADELVLPEEG